MNDIVARLRAIERAIWDGGDDEERRAFIKMVADEIERLRAENHGLRIKVFTLLKKLEEK